MQDYTVFYVLFEKESRRIISYGDTVMKSDGFPMIAEILVWLRNLEPNHEIGVTGCVEKQG